MSFVHLALIPVRDIHQYKVERGCSSKEIERKSSEAIQLLNRRAKQRLSSRRRKRRRRRRRRRKIWGEPRVKCVVWSEAISRSSEPPFFRPATTIVRFLYHPFDWSLGGCLPRPVCYGRWIAAQLIHNAHTFNIVVTLLDSFTFPHPYVKAPVLAGATYLVNLDWYNKQGI